MALFDVAGNAGLDRLRSALGSFGQPQAGTTNPLMQRMNTAQPQLPRQPTQGLGGNISDMLSAFRPAAAPRPAMSLQNMPNSGQGLGGMLGGVLSGQMPRPAQGQQGGLGGMIAGAMQNMQGAPQAPQQGGSPQQNQPFDRDRPLYERLEQSMSWLNGINDPNVKALMDSLRSNPMLQKGYNDLMGSFGQFGSPQVPSGMGQQPQPQAPAPQQPTPQPQVPPMAPSSQLPASQAYGPQPFANPATMGGQNYTVRRNPYAGYFGPAPGQQQQQGFAYTPNAQPGVYY